MSFILTSISGNPISAASAGYAPTNSAEVSAIASSYAESAASGKLDSTAFNSADFYGTANESGFVDSAYVDSAVSGKQDALTFAYDADSAISSINGSALAGGGGGATGDYVEKSATSVAIGSNSVASNNSLAVGTKVQSYDWSIAVGRNNSGGYNGAALGDYTTAYHYAAAQGFYAYAYEQSFCQGCIASALNTSLAQGNYVSASSNSFAQGTRVSAYNTAAVFGTYNLKGNGNTSTGHSAAFVIGDGTSNGARHDLMVVTKDGEITMFSSTADTTGTGILSSIRAISAAAGGGGVDSATVSAIASSYAESAASGKLDTTAFNSGDFYSTANPSGFITGVDLSPYQTTADMSGYVPTSVSSDFQQVTGMSSYALSADVSGTVDLVTGSSSTWNGVTAKMDSTAFQSAYASASASQATAQGVLYILIPDGV